MKASNIQSKPDHNESSWRHQEKDSQALKRDGKGQKKCVAFEPKAFFLLVNPLSAFSNEEISSIWYQQAEFLDFRRDIKKTAKAMAKGWPEGVQIMNSRSTPAVASSATPTREYCYRGIEHLQSADVLRSRQNERKRLMETILSHQGLLAPPKHLAKLSRRMSSEGVQRAIEAGINDADEARRYSIAARGLQSSSYPRDSAVLLPER
mmetsp:Transcript_31078/g.90940  ORF Transcript_31078/g.90940 Transcript_31078/m.90940 type:complete len:207 (-) Transcript_31078:1129-1749(-)